MKFKSAILYSHNEPLRIEELEPLPLEYGQVLVRVLTSGICGAQLNEIRGTKDENAPMPRPMGHEGCGEVVELGPGVNKVKVGDFVCMHWRQGFGVDSDFPRYRLNGSTITSGRITTFSEYAVVSENRITAVPDSVPSELMTLMGCSLSTALGTIENEANLLMGESILVVGCGGLGLNLIRAARMRRAGLIHALDIVKEKQSAAIAAGADLFAWDSHELALKKYDVIVDTTGVPVAIADTLTFMAPGGRYFMVGQPGPKQAIMLHGANHLFHGSGKTIKATQGGCFNPSVDIPRYVGLWRSGQLDYTGTITHQFPLENINEALKIVRDGQAGRVILKCT